MDSTLSPITAALMSLAALIASPRAHAAVPAPFEALQARASSLPSQHALKTSLTLSLGRGVQDVRAAITVRRSGARSSGLCGMQLALSQETSYLHNGLRIVGRTREAHAEAQCASLAKSLTRLAEAEMQAFASAAAGIAAKTPSKTPSQPATAATALAAAPVRALPATASSPLAALTPVKFPALSARSAKAKAILPPFTRVMPNKLRGGTAAQQPAMPQTHSANLSDRIYRIRAAEHAVLRSAPARSGRKVGRLSAGSERRARLVANAPGWFELLDATGTSFVHESAVNQSPVTETARADDQQIAFAGGSR